MATRPAAEKEFPASQSRVCASKWIPLLSKFCSRLASSGGSVGCPGVEAIVSIGVSGRPPRANTSALQAPTVATNRRQTLPSHHQRPCSCGVSLGKNPSALWEELGKCLQRRRRRDLRAEIAEGERLVAVVEVQQPGVSLKGGPRTE